MPACSCVQGNDLHGSLWGALSCWAKVWQIIIAAVFAFATKKCTYFAILLKNEWIIEVIGFAVFFNWGNLRQSFTPSYPKRLWIDEQAFCNAFPFHIVFDQDVSNYNSVFLFINRCQILKYTKTQSFWTILTISCLFSWWWSNQVSTFRSLFPDCKPRVSVWMSTLPLFTQMSPSISRASRSSSTANLY